MTQAFTATQARTQDEPETERTQTQMTSTPQPFSPSGMEIMVEKAKEDLAQRLPIPKNQIALIEAIPVTWPDASLGCPQPGELYAKGNTPGYSIVLETSGNQYTYHTDIKTQAILCQGEMLPLFPVKPGEIDDGQPWMPVEPIEPETESPSK